MADSLCFETKVRNMTGRTAVFGFLPPHGKRLEAGEEYSFFGDFAALMSAIGSQRKRESFKTAIVAGDIAVVTTPAQHYYDETLDVTKVIDVDNGAVSVADPCWGAYSSSIDGGN